MAEPPDTQTDQNEEDHPAPWEWAFEVCGRNPLAWRASAEDLLAAANAVKEKVENVAPMMHSLAGVQAMLLGLAIECLLKGVWIKKGAERPDEDGGPSLTQDGKYRRIPRVGDHELRRLAHAAGHTFTPADAAVLDRLTAFVKYAGRYPIPTNVDQMKPKKSGSGEPVSPDFISADELQQAEQIAARLMNDVLPWR